MTPLRLSMCPGATLEHVKGEGIKKEVYSVRRPAMCMLEGGYRSSESEDLLMVATLSCFSAEARVQRTKKGLLFSIRRRYLHRERARTALQRVRFQQRCGNVVSY